MSKANQILIKTLEKMKFTICVLISVVLKGSLDRVDFVILHTENLNVYIHESM